MIDTTSVRRRFEARKPYLNERQRRLFAASEVAALGPGSISPVCRATGMSYKAVRRGLRELQGQEDALPAGRVRRPGGGRKRCVDKDAGLMDGLREVVESSTRGDPTAPRLWTTRSVRSLRQELAKRGHLVGDTTIRRLLHGLGYSLQSNRKTKEGSSHPDRDAQFQQINTALKRALDQGQPVISVDTKKKELVGDFKNGGRELRPKGDPEQVQMHDFPIPELGKVSPYGVYDVGANVGWVSIGIDHDTAAFAVHAIRAWWREMGQGRYPAATCLTITAECGGSNGSRVRLWKVELQKLADETGLDIAVHHLPPGTSKWNKIEHRLFSDISINWRGKPLISHAAIVQLISATTTAAGLTVKAVIDPKHDPTGIKVEDADLAAVHLRRHEFHGEWNYTISPKQTQPCP